MNVIFLQDAKGIKPPDFLHIHLKAAGLLCAAQPMSPPLTHTSPLHRYLRCYYYAVRSLIDQVSQQVHSEPVRDGCLSVVGETHAHREEPYVVVNSYGD